MENINAYLVSKISLLRYLLVFVVLTQSLVASAQQQHKSELDGKWQSSGGQAQYHKNNQRYYFEVKKSGEVDLRLEAKEGHCSADAYLYLLRLDGELVTSNDDGDWDDIDDRETQCYYSSRITTYLTSGKYILVTATYAPGVNGNYKISIRGAEDSLSDLSDAQQSAEVKEFPCSSSWNNSYGRYDYNYDTQRYEYVTSPGNPTFELNISKKSQVVIDLTSSADTYLYLLNQQTKEILFYDDDGGVGYNSKIEKNLNPGSYAVIAATYSRSRKRDFELKAMLDSGSGQLKCDSRRPQENFSIGGDIRVVYGDGTHSVANESINLPIYQRKYIFTQQATGAEGTGAITYTSSNPDFEVDSISGKVTYQNIGTTTITAIIASDNNFTHASSQYSLSVRPAAQADLSIGDEKTIAFSENGSFSRQPTGGTGDGKVTYESTNLDFSVDENGVVTFKNTGETTIKATKSPPNDNYFEAYAEYKLVVTKGAQDDFNAGQNQVRYLTPGATLTQKATGGSGVGKITYAVSDENLAVVSNEGVVTFNNLGTVLITVTKDGDNNYLPATNSYQLEIRKASITYANKYDKIADIKTEYTITKFDTDEGFSLQNEIKQLAEDLDDFTQKPNFSVTDGSSVGVTGNGEITIKNHGVSIVSISEMGSRPIKIKLIILDSKDLFEFTSGEKIEISDKQHEITWDPGAYVNSEISLYYTLYNTKVKNPDTSIIEKQRPVEGAYKIKAKTGSFKWDTSKLPEGEYYVVARLRDKITDRAKRLGRWTNSEVYIAVKYNNKVIVEHDHGFARDCSKFYNDPFHNDYPKKRSIDESCNNAGFAYIHPDDGRIVTWSTGDEYTDLPHKLKKDNNGYQKIYPYQAGFVAFKTLNGNPVKSRVDVWSNGERGKNHTYNVEGEIKEIQNLSYGNGLVLEMKDGTKKTLGNCKGPMKCKVQGLNNKIYGVDAGRPIGKPENEDVDFLFKLNRYRAEDGQYTPNYYKHKNRDGVYTKYYRSNEVYVAVKDNGDAYFWGPRIQIEGFSEFGPEVKIFHNQRTSSVALKRHNEFQPIYWSDDYFGYSTTSIWSDRKQEKVILGSKIDVSKIYTNSSAYAALRMDGSILTFGNKMCGAGSDSPDPKETGYVAIYSNYCGFVAVKANGDMTSWGDFSHWIYYSAYSEHIKQGGEIHTFDVDQIKNQRKVTAPSKYDFDVSPEQEKTLVLNPVSVELLSDRQVEVDWSDFKNSIKGIYLKGAIIYSDNSFATSEGLEEWAVNSASRSDDFEPDSFSLRLSNLNLDESYYVSMVLWDASNKIVAYSKEAKISVPHLVFVGNKTADLSYEIKWNSQSLNNKKISLFYDLNNSPEGDIKIQGADNLSAEQGTFTWNTTSLPEGNYYIYARLDDGSQTKYRSQKPVVINHQHGITDCSSWYSFEGGQNNSRDDYCKYVAKLSDDQLSLEGFSGIETRNDGYTSVQQSLHFYLAVGDEFVDWVRYDDPANKQTVNGSFTSINLNMDAFAALDQNGSITVSGEVECGGQAGDQPQEAGYETIASSMCAFAALKDGQISSWGENSVGGGQIPTHSNVTQLFSNWGAFAALQDNGKIITWGVDVYGGTGGPEDSGYIAIASGNNSFSAIKADGTVVYWGIAQEAGSAHFLKAPEKIDGNVAIYANKNAFAALSSQGEISIWGPTTHGGSWRILTGVGRLVQRSEISDKGFQSIAVTSSAFAALKDDGSILSWGDCADTYGETMDCDGLEPGQSQGVYTKIYSNSKAFAALDSNGYIATWGSPKCGGSPAGSDTNIKSPPTGDGYTSIYAGECHFTAVNKDGSDFHWGKLE